MAELHTTYPLAHYTGYCIQSFASGQASKSPLKDDTKNEGKTAAALTSWSLCSLAANQGVTTTATKDVCGI